MTPAVSVIIATYNYGRFLGGALDSVLGQTFGDFEVLVIDDGSTDNTRQVIQPYLSDPRVSYHYTDHVLQPRAKNKGIRLAKAPLIAFLDADDLWLPTKLERQVALFRGDPELGVVYARALFIDAHGHPLECPETTYHAGHVLDQMFFNNFITFSSAMVRRTVFERVGLFDEALELAIDFDFWLRVAPRFRFAYVDERLVQYRTGHANLSTRTEERFGTAIAIMNRFLDEKGGRAQVRPDMARRAFAQIYSSRGLFRRKRSLLRAVPCYLRALTYQPGYPAAWKGLASSFLPERLRGWLRRRRGRPADWSMP